MIPDYQSLMLPLLKFVNEQREFSVQECINFLAKTFNLSEEELNEWLPSKKQKIFYNRVYWAKAHLKMAGGFRKHKKRFF
jgi:restriction system protein